MATPRPYKQLPLLPLVRVSPRRPRALTPLSGGNSLRTPSWPPSPAPHSSLPATASRLRAFPPEGPAQGSERRAARGSRRGRGNRTPPHPLPIWTDQRCRRLLGRSLWRGGQGWVHAWGFPFLSSGLRVAIPHVSAACPCLPTECRLGARKQV